MKRQDVIDNIEGSRLKKQFLEAFLLQSTFMESLLKKLVEDDLFANVVMKIYAKEVEGGESFTPSKQVEFIKEKLLRKTQFEMIEYLAKIDLIDIALKKKLHHYREGRNEILHNLVGKMSVNSFEDELKNLVTEGQEILNDPKLIKVSENLQFFEDLMDAVHSGLSDAVSKVLKRYAPPQKELGESALKSVTS